MVTLQLTYSPFKSSFFNFPTLQFMFSKFQLGVLLMLYALTNFLSLQYMHAFFFGSQFYSFSFFILNFCLFLYSLSFSFPRSLVLYFFFGFYFSICPRFDPFFLFHGILYFCSLISDSSIHLCLKLYPLFLFYYLFLFTY